MWKRKPKVCEHDEHPEGFDEQFKRIADANEAVAAAHSRNTDVRFQAMNFAIAHAQHIANLESNPQYVRDFQAIMLRAETILTFLLDDRAD